MRKYMRFRVLDICRSTYMYLTCHKSWPMYELPMYELAYVWIYYCCSHYNEEQM